MCPRFDPGSGHHFFAYTPDGDTPFGFFLCLVLRLNCKDLRLFRQNGEFETGAFRRAEIRQNPPNSPFGDFWGHGNLPSCKCFICRTFFEKSLFFSCFSNECKGEFCFTNHRPLSIFLDNQRVTRKSEIFVFITNAHHSIDIAVSPIAVLGFSGISFCFLTVFCFMFLR